MTGQMVHPESSGPGSAADEALVVRSLSAGYGRIRVCRDISFTLRRGESLSIVGINGAGKSTLLRALAGETQFGGSIQMDGVALDALPVRRRALAGLAFVPEGRGNLFPGLSVEDNLELARRRSSLEAREVYEGMIATAFPFLARRLDDRASNLSGGEQQMLAVSCALLAAPRIIVLDEPSQGLAPTILRAIEQSLVTIRQAGLSMIVAEQNLDFARGVSDRYLHVDHGELVGSGDSAMLEDLEFTSMH